MTIKELYIKINANYDEALTRLMNEKLIERFSQKYLADHSYSDLMQAVEDGNIENAFRAAHTLKGVAANLAFSDLQQAASNLTEQLRSLSEKPDMILVEKVKAAQEIVVKGLNEYKEQM